MNDGLQSGYGWPSLRAGLYHGLSPGMGWRPRRGGRTIGESGAQCRCPRAYWQLAILAAMAVVLLPFARFTVVSDHSGGIRIGRWSFGGGIWPLPSARSPPSALLARIKPTQRARGPFWDGDRPWRRFFLFGLPRPRGNGRPRGAWRMHQMAENRVSLLIIVSIIHTLAMIAAGGGLAWLV